MKHIKFFFIVFLTFIIFTKSIAAELYFVDVSQILNKSKAGKQAQDFLKKKFDEENDKLKKDSIALKKEESDLISKKKLVSNDEYKKSLNQEVNLSFFLSKNLVKSSFF